MRRTPLLLTALLALAATAAASADLSPARNLRGTWVSPLKGKAYQLTGRLDVPGSGWADIVETGDIRLALTRVDGNKAYGTITLSNKVETYTLTIKTVKGLKRYPAQRITSTEATSRQIVLTASSSRVSFSKVPVKNATVALTTGRFTTSLLWGTMTETFQGAASVGGTSGTMTRPLSGPFKLMKSG